ncbi:alpha/beta hydrolase [Streptomyces sp. NRRL F-2664]|uniref:alpha/beta hydrolase n=1 Tax=Streptomyces sp. NRRL F-2664 TaxID=1463842 RepID=UPI000998B094|nr:alpha/beta hydrolase [Streptomyces sp. NRRL F-2664]
MATGTAGAGSAGDVGGAGGTDGAAPAAHVGGAGGAGHETDGGGPSGAGLGSRAVRGRGGRLRRTLLAALVAAAVIVPVTAAASAQAPAPAPAVFTETASPRSRYAANLDNLAVAARMAEDADRSGRAGRLRAMAAGGTAQFLAFDGRGRGRAVEVLGELETAERIAVLVPGSDTTLDTYERFRSGAAALHQRLLAEHPRSAVVAWLGYDTPGTVSTTVLTADRADEAAAELGPFLDRLDRISAPGARLSLLCHSYGSVVCARTRTGPAVGDMVLFGSPGTGAASARELPTAARVWAGRGGSDWVARVPHVRFGGIGFGTDPVDPAFGARAFTVGAGGHSDYLKPGTRSLDTLAAIVLGTAPAQEASRA